MKRLLKSWVFWAFVAAPAAGVVVRFTERHFEREACFVCWSSKWRATWRIGDERVGFLTVWRGEETRVQSCIFLDGWTDAHEHAWQGVFAGREEPTPLIGDPDGFRGRYEGDAAFRSFLLAKRRAGEAGREDFLLTLEHPIGASCGSPPPSVIHARVKALGWVEEYLRKPR